MKKNTPPQTKEEYLAAMAARYDKRMRKPQPVGRPSLASETMQIVHIAAAQHQGPLTQGRLCAATRALFDELHVTYPDCVAPAQNTLRLYVKAYLQYRRGLASLKQFPKHIQLGFERLPDGIHADTLLGLVGAYAPGVKLHGPRAQKQADLTTCIQAITSLSSPSK